MRRVSRPAILTPRVIAAGGSVGTSGWTWDAGDKTAGMTLSESDLRWTGSAAPNDYVRGNIVLSGKVYWEIECLTSTDGISGIKRASQSISDSNQILGYRRGGTGQHINTVTGASTGAGTPAGYGATDILIFCVDTVAQLMWTGKNGVWNLSGDPATGANPSFSSIGAVSYEPHGWSSNNSGSSHRIRPTFMYPPPSGFSGL